jgi:transposase InsO family protein
VLYQNGQFPAANVSQVPTYPLAQQVRIEAVGHNVEWFRTRREARIVIEAWRHHYNAVRPHMSLNYLTPIEFRTQHQPLATIPNRAVFQE